MPAAATKIGRTLVVGGSTVYRTKRRFVEGNLERALSEEPRPGAERKLTGKEEAMLVATACANPPEGRARWTPELLADAMVNLTAHESLSSETVRRRLAENGLKPWRKDMWCIPKVDGEYVARMEDVLDLYAETPDPNRPVVCFDESPVQLIGEVRQPIPAEPGQLERYDNEYRGNGTVNLFVCIDVNRPWRKVKVTERRAAEDYAQCMRELVDVHYPDAACIRVVQDNLSTHSAGALYEAFAPVEARRILQRLEFHYTPKHASWLNAGELQPSLFDNRDLAEIASLDYPGERLVVCRNPLLAEERARKRRELLAATEEKLRKIQARVRRAKRPLRGSDAIGIAVGKIIDHYKMAKHFDLTITDTDLVIERRTQPIDEVAALDGIYVVRTNVKADLLDSHGPEVRLTGLAG
jgi:transposase